MVCLAVEPGAAGWKAQTNPLSHGGTHCHNTLNFAYDVSSKARSCRKILTWIYPTIYFKIFRLVEHPIRMLITRHRSYRSFPTLWHSPHQGIFYRIEIFRFGDTIKAGLLLKCYRLCRSNIFWGKAGTK